MRAFFWNVMLSLVWAFSIGEFTLANVLIGYVLGYAVLGLVREVFGPSRYYWKVFEVFGFLCFYLWEMFLANMRVAYDVCTPTYYMKPGIIGVPLDVKSPEAITLLASVITLTPGSISLDVSEDGKILYVHAMFIDDAEEEKRKLKEGFERRIAELLR